MVVRRVGLAGLCLFVGGGAAQAATRSVPAGSTQAQIQAILSGAVSGDVLSFAAGTYGFTGKLTLKNGLVIEGDNCPWIGIDNANIHTADFNANGGGVLGNTLNSGGIALAPGIAQSGNVIR